MSDQSRRKLLKSIAAGSGAVIAGKSLPESWSRPVVDSVVLPAHAQTSGEPAVEPVVRTYFVTNPVYTENVDNFSDPSLPPVFAGILNSLVPSANAQGSTTYICVTHTVGTTTIDFHLREILLGEGAAYAYDPITIDVIGNVPFSGGQLMSETPCPNPGGFNGVPVQISVVGQPTETEITLMISDSQTSVSVGDCNLPSVMCTPFNPDV